MRSRWFAPVFLVSIVAAGALGCPREHLVTDAEMRALREDVGRECSRLPAIGGPFEHKFPLQGDTQSEACKQAVEKIMAAHEQRERLRDGGGL